MKTNLEMKITPKLSSLSMAVLSACLLALLPSANAAAGNATWSGATDGLWLTATNWSGSLIPGVGNTATFNAASGNTTITVGTISLANITFDTSSAAAYTLGAGTITFGNGTTTAVNMNSTVTNNEIINANLTLGNGTANTTTFQNDSTTGLLTLGGTIIGGTGGTAAAKTVTFNGSGNTAVGGIIGNGGATSLALSKSGAGTLTLRAANTYTGNTTVTAGTLALDFSAVGAPATNILAAGPGQSTTGSLVLGNSGGAQAAASETLNLIGKANVANSQAFTGINLYYGASHINLTPGTGTGSVAMRAGYIYRGATAVAGVGSTLDISLPTNTSATTVAGNFNVRNSANTAVSSGIIHGGITVNGNTWAVSNATTLGSISSTSGNSTLTVASGAPTDGSQIMFGTAPTGLTAGVIYYVLNGGSSATSFQVAATPGGTAINATSTIANGSMNIEGSLTGLASYVTNWSGNSTASTGTNIDVTASGNLASANTGGLPGGPGSIRFNTGAPTTVTLTSGALANTIVPIQSGGILVTSAVGNNLSKITGGILQGETRRDLTIIQNNSSNILQIDSIIADQGGFNGGITKSGAGTLLLTGNNTFGVYGNFGSVVNEGKLIVAGDVVAGATRTGSITAGSATLTMTDTSGRFIGEEVSNGTALNGNFSYIVTGITANTSVTLSKTANGTTVTDGSFVFSGAGGLGVGAGSGVTIAAGATLQIGNGGTTGSLVPVAAITNNGTLVFNKTTTLTQGADFSTAAITGTGGVTQIGSGSTVLNAANTYTGTTTVSAGKLTIGSTGTINSTGAVSIGAGEFNYNSSTALSQGVIFSSTGGTLSGSGTITPAVTVSSGNFLSPGNSIGTLSFGTGLTIAGTYTAQLGTAGSTPATGVSDLAAVTGNLVLSGGTLSLLDNANGNGNGTAGPGAYRLITYTGTKAGTFATVTNAMSATLHESVVYNGTSNGTVDVNLYRLATANAITSPVALANVHVGGTFVASALSIQNTAAATFSEGLNASGGTLGGSASTSGTITNLTASTTDSSTLLVGLGGSTHTGAAGAVTGTVLVNLASNGNGTSGYGTTSLTGQTITVNGGVYNLAAANAIATPATLKTRVNGTFGTAALSIQNTAASGNYTEGLNATMGAITGNATVSGTNITNLAGNATSTTISVGLGNANTNTVGNKSGTVTIDLASNGSTTSGLSNTGLTSQLLTVSGIVYDNAQPTFSKVIGGSGTFGGNGTSYTLNFGTGLALNTDYTATIRLDNNQISLFQDSLGGNYTGGTATGYATTATNFGGLSAVAPGNFNTFTITFNTGISGTFTDTLTLAGLSQQSGLSDASLTSINIGLTGTAVPEPATWALLAFSLTTVMVLRRRRRE